MHDFGEDVPADAVFHNGKSGAEMHNMSIRFFIRKPPMKPACVIKRM